jgi:hypothetical protein
VIRVVDLTHHLFDEMAVYPGIPQPEFRAIARVVDDGYAMSEYHLINHIGTHIDAPSHQIAGGATLDEIPLDRLITDAVTIDVSDLEAGPIDRKTLEQRAGEVREETSSLRQRKELRVGRVLDRVGILDADAPHLLIERASRGSASTAVLRSGRHDDVRSPPRQAGCGPADPREPHEPRRVAPALPGRDRADESPRLRTAGRRGVCVSVRRPKGCAPARPVGPASSGTTS